MSTANVGTSAHPSECNPPVRVFVDGTEVPTVSGSEGDIPAVESQLRKTGVSDLSRASDVTIPFEWAGEDILGTILDAPNDGFHSLTNKPVRIELLDEASDEYFVVHQGYIANAGPSPDIGAFRLFVGDWADFFDRVGINLTFKGQNPLTVLETIRDEMESHEGVPSFPISTPIPDASVDQEGTIYFNDGPIGNFATFFLESQANRIERFEDPITGALGVQEQFDETYEWDIGETKTEFVDHKNSCADVLNWLADQLNARWYIDFSTDGNATLVFDTDITAPQLTAYNLGDSPEGRNVVRLIGNNMLFQISPPHTYGARGERGPDTDGVPKVRVEHEDLAARSGENQQPVYHDVEAKGLQQTINVAKSRLKRMIDDAAGGQAVALPAPLARPYGTIEAKPACQGRLDRDVNAIRYGIEEVVHDISYPSTEANLYPKTIIRGGVVVEKDDIVVTDKEIVNK